MALLKLDIPAGFKRNGTDYEAEGRWRDGSLVRWRDGSLRPIGGWRERKVDLTTDAIRSLFAWEANDGSAWLAAGSHDELKAMTGSGTTYDLTPTDLANGYLDAEVETGYGYGAYGAGFYGVPIQQLATAIPVPATTWSLDAFGQYLVACADSDGRILQWDLNVANKAAVVANAPTDCLGLVVTEERSLMALGADGDPRRVAFSDLEDNTTWTPASDNQAGAITLQTSGMIMQGVRTRGATLLITDADAFAITYTGPPFVYSAQRISTSCGAISRKSAIDTPIGVFWFGQASFHLFDGNTVKEVPCEVYDFVFGDLNRSQQSKIWGISNGQYNEVTWFFPSDASVEIDRYVTYDYVQNVWTFGSMARTSGVERGVFRYPFLADAGGDVYEHEIGVNYDGASVFAETGPISLGNGDATMSITEIIPDEKTQGDVSLTFKTRFHPNDTERSYGPFVPSNPTSARFSGRQIRMRIEGTELADWRVGNIRLEAKPAGRR